MKNASCSSALIPLVQRMAAGLVLSFVLAAAACSNDDSDGADENSEGGSTAGDLGSTGGVRSTRTVTAAGGTSFSSMRGSAGASPSFGGRNVGVAGGVTTGVSVAGASGRTTVVSGVAGSGVAGGRSTAPSIAGAGSIDVRCVSSLACTTGCTATCPGNSAASYACACNNGRLDCDVAPCVVGATTCETGSTCTKDCSGKCPADSSKTFTCSCDNGRLDCDLAVCSSTTIGGQCPATNSDGVACDSDVEDLCTPPANSSETLCLCFSNQWMCI